MIQTSDALHVGAVKVNEDFGSWLRKIRLEKRWTQRTLATRSGLSLGYISSVENGKRKPKTSSLVALAQALDIPYAQALQSAGYLDDGLVLFAHRLRTTRTSLGMTVDELASLCGVSIRTLERWESSPKSWPSEQTLAKLAAALTVSVEYLRGQSDATTSYPIDLQEILEQPDLTYNGVTLNPEQLKFVRDFLQGVIQLSAHQTPTSPQKRPPNRK
jgi:transcriptional regulator with XRE-family HTH domain